MWVLFINAAVAAPELGELELERVLAPIPEAGDSFGRSLGAGDFNGDGYIDLAISAQGDDEQAEDAGAVHLWHSGPTGPIQVGTLYAPDAALRESFGQGLSGAGDVDGDGYDDLLVGVPGRVIDGVSSGAAVLFFGAPEGLGAPQLLYDLDGAAGDRFGYRVAGAGDVNGDGFDDLMVAALRDDAGINAGAVTLLFGGEGGPELDAAQRLTPDELGDADDFGAAMGGVGDVDGDGFEDLLIGAWHFDGEDSDSGSVWFYPGGEEGLAGEVRLEPQLGEVADSFGSAISGGGDVNADGYADVLIGAVGWSSQRGRVYLYLGGARGPDAQTEQPLAGYAGQPWDAFGTSLSLDVDVDGDGHADALIGAPGDDGLGADAGAAWLYLGGAVGLELDAVKLEDELGGADAELGYAVLGAGDIDGDGDGDLLLGALGADDEGAGTGAALIVYGACAEPRIYYADLDGDGFGDPDSPGEGCGPPLGHVEDDSDCDDLDPGRYPGAEELEGDGVDQDCDGVDPTDTGLGGAEDKPCGCAAGAARPGWPFGLLGLFALRRRRASRPRAPRGPRPR